MEKELLEHVGCEDEDMDTHARSLLENIGGIGAARKLARKNMAEKFQEAAEKYQRDAQEQFEALQKDAQYGCRIGVIMDIVLYVCTADTWTLRAQFLRNRRRYGYAVRQELNRELSSYTGLGVSGGAGTLGMLYTIVIARPRKQVADTVDHLMKMKIIFLGYVHKLNEAGQVFTRQMMDDEGMSTDLLQAFIDTLDDMTKEGLDQLRRVTEESERSSGWGLPWARHLETGVPGRGNAPASGDPENPRSRKGADPLRMPLLPSSGGAGPSKS
eukprot:scaffold6830_cov202-Prasinococcus_capsulatus_cf.AAC.2